MFIKNILKGYFKHQPIKRMVKEIYLPCKSIGDKPINGWTVKKQIVAGSINKVMQVCRKNQCGYVMKVISDDDHNDIKREICFQNICAEYGLCKPVKDWWLCPAQETGYEIGGVIITPILKMTLRERRKSLENGEKDWKLLKQALRLILQLHHLGISHGDAHSNNFMVDKDDKVFLIDMGLSELTNQSDPRDYEMFGKSCCNDLSDPYSLQIMGISYDVNERALISEESVINIETEIVENVLKKSYSDILKEWKDILKKL